MHALRAFINVAGLLRRRDEVLSAVATAMRRLGHIVSAYLTPRRDNLRRNIFDHPRIPAGDSGHFPLQFWSIKKHCALLCLMTSNPRGSLSYAFFHFQRLKTYRCVRGYPGSVLGPCTRKGVSVRPRPRPPFSFRRRMDNVRSANERTKYVNALSQVPDREIPDPRPAWRDRATSRKFPGVKSPRGIRWPFQ